ncbi:MAG: hypothetical protein PHR16_16685 [Methylovulum sp.]|nr:hypothetical protein [Methylovulum sp.]
MTHIKLRPAEITSGLDRVRWAELLIRQLPDDHDGRNSWLLNYAGDKHNADLAPVDSFQSRVRPWMMACFGEGISADRQERCHRFLEEALELVQSLDCSLSEAHQLVDYVFGRDVGETSQEVGGVMVTLGALCLAVGVDMHEAGETELARIWTKIERIRAKHAAKPKHSPLPEQTP